jgi:hypothetical protein
VQQADTEGDTYLAISDIRPKQLQGESHAAAVYNVPRITTQRRRDGKRCRCDLELNAKHLTKLEEEMKQTFKIWLSVCGESTEGSLPARTGLLGLLSKPELRSQRNCSFWLGEHYLYRDDHLEDLVKDDWVPGVIHTHASGL